MSKIKKRKDGRYQKNIKIGYQPNGKPKYKCIMGKTQAELQYKIDEFMSLYNQGIINGDKTTLKDWTLQWLETYKKPLAYNTYKMYERCVKGHILTAPFADKKIIDITLAEVQAYLNSKLSTPRAAQIIRMTLKQIFDAAVDNNLTLRNPAARVKLPVHKSAPKRTLTDTEARAITAADLTPMQKLFIDFGRYAGLRRGEILALTRGDIDLKKNVIRVNKTLILKSKGESVVKHSPKTAAGFREVPLLAPIRTTLKDYKYDLYLFHDKDGRLLNKNAFRKMWKGIINALNLPQCSLTPHILRHTYATNLYYAGIDIKTAQSYLGHSDIKTTLDIYTHLQIDNSSAVAKLNKYLAK